MEALQIKVTEYEVTVTGKPQRINAGNVEYIKCEFDIDEAFTGYVIRASFNGEYRLIENGECYAPILDEGECEIRVYGCILDGDVYETVISPKPTKIIVGRGSFDPGDVEASEIPATEVEQIERKLTGKQDKLTAGTGITIENNVISSTGGGGGSYSAGDGIDISNNAISVDKDATLKFTNALLGIDFARMVDNPTYESGWVQDDGKAIDGATLNSVVNSLVDVFAQVFNAIFGKQDKLTAGAGISIVNDIISATLGVSFEVVQTLPQTGAAQTIYLVPKTGSTGDVYDEYIWLGSAYEKIGSTDVDLSQYYTKTQTDTLLAGKQAVGDYATNTALTDGLALKADASTTYTKTEVNTALAGKQNVRTETNITDSTLTALTIAKDTDYVFKTLVGTMALSLASAFNSGRSTLTFTTGDTPAVSISTPTGMPIKWHGEVITSFEANTTYELDFRVVELPQTNETTGDVELVNTLIIAGGAVTEASE